MPSHAKRAPVTAQTGCLGSLHVEASTKSLRVLRARRAAGNTPVPKPPRSAQPLLQTEEVPGYVETESAWPTNLNPLKIGCYLRSDFSWSRPHKRAGARGQTSTCLLRR